VISRKPAAMLWRRTSPGVQAVPFLDRDSRTTRRLVKRRTGRERGDEAGFSAARKEIRTSAPNAMRKADDDAEEAQARKMRYPR